MIRVFSHDNILYVHNIKNLLEHQGIACEIRNEMVASAAGEAPPTAVWPEVWILREQDHTKAEQIVEKAMNGPRSETSWLCPECGEHNAPAFELCWHCHHEREAE